MNPMIKEGLITALVAAICCVVPTGAALAAMASGLAPPDMLSHVDLGVIGAASGASGGTIRAMRADTPTLRALTMDAGTGALAGFWTWPFTLSIFGPVRLGRRFTGKEIDPAYFDTACRRIADEIKRPRMALEAPPPAQVQEAMAL